MIKTLNNLILSCDHQQALLKRNEILPSIYRPILS